VASGSPHYEDAEKLIYKLVCGPFDNNVYVLVCKSTKKALVVDASEAPSRLGTYLAGTDPVAVVITHGHRDHVGEVSSLRRELKLRVGIHAKDADSIPGGPDFTLEHGQTLQVGDLRLTALHTPGHTPGSTCYYIPPVLFSGDTLFPGGPGNTWGNKKAFEAIIASIEESLFVLPDDTLVLPGHGLDTTIGTEKPALDEWKARGW
jgi:glyoxylase-like metal-dependent hydrolase (beta-lactamase superfamily II)